MIGALNTVRWGLCMERRVVICQGDWLCGMAACLLSLFPHLVIRTDIRHIYLRGYRTRPSDEDNTPIIV